MKTFPCLLLLIAFFSVELPARAQQSCRDSLSDLLDRTTDPQKRISLLIHILDLSDSEKEENTVAALLYKESKTAKNAGGLGASLGTITLQLINRPDGKDSLFRMLREIEPLLKNTTEEGLNYYYEMVYRARILSTAPREQQAETGKQILQELDREHPETNPFVRVEKLFLTGVVYYLLTSEAENKENKEPIPYLEEAWSIACDFPPSSRKNFCGNIYILLSSIYNSKGEDKKLIRLSDAYLKILDAYFSLETIKRRRPYFYKDNLYLLCYQQLMINPHLIGKKKAREYYRRFCEYMENGKGDALQRNRFYFYSFSYSYFKSIQAYKQALAFSDSLINLIETTKTVNAKYVIHYYGRATTLQELGQYEKACNAYERTLKVADSLARKEQLKSISEMQVNYEIDKLKLRKAKLSVHYHQMALVCSIVLLLVMIGFLVYSYINLKRTQKLQAELFKQKEKALHSEKKKTSFINSVCHEVRTPLNAIFGFSELITEDNSEKKEEYFNFIWESCDQLTYLLNDMLEVASLENLSHPLPKEKVNVSAICEKQMNLLQRKYRKENISYTTEIQKDIVFLTHPKYFSILIHTLLNNANKFTQKGEIHLSCQWNDKKKEVHIAVTDTGCGIPSDQYDYVFERFTKLNPFSQGNGLGLYLCRLIMDQLNGSLRIDPSYKQGTRFLIVLPQTEERPE